MKLVRLTLAILIALSFVSCAPCGPGYGYGGYYNGGYYNGNGGYNAGPAYGRGYNPQPALNQSRLMLNQYSRPVYYNGGGYQSFPTGNQGFPGGGQFWPNGYQGGYLNGCYGGYPDRPIRNR